jgi:hypothetical protein
MTLELNDAEKLGAQRLLVGTAGILAAISVGGAVPGAKPANCLAQKLSSFGFQRFKITVVFIFPLGGKRTLTLPSDYV